MQAVPPTPFVPTSVARQSTPIIIPYVRALPKSVSGLMPRGARSLFWGTFIPKAGSVPMAIHLFARYPIPELVSNDVSSIGRKRLFALDVFEQHRKQFVQIKRNLISYPSSIGWSPVLVTARLFWLDLTQKQPLLVIECFTKDGYFSDMPYGDALFIPFVKGWRGGTSLQSSNFGASNSGSRYYRVERDLDGLLQINRDDGSMNAGVDAQGNDLHAIYIFKWKRRRFVATQDTIQAFGPLEHEDKQFKP